ncbi:MAG: HAMP domain-containing protein [Gammaproteobacteria bacterium]|nr:HAMP domain-containing protein [Gammaproteobacteria bacterium]
METFKNFTLNTFALNSLWLRLILVITFFIALITAILQYYSLVQFEEASTLNLEHEGLLLSDTLEATTLHELAQNNIQTIQEHINRLVSNREINDIEINILSISPNGSEIVVSNVSDNIEAADEEDHLELLDALNSGQANIFFEVETNDNDPDDIDLHELEIEAGENHPDNYFQDNSRYMSITTPLILDGEKLGGINVKLSLHPLDIKLTQIRKMLLMSILAATALVLFGFGLLMNKKIFLPISQLKKDMDSVANGDLDLQLAASSRVDEIGQLAQAFNCMTKQLQRTQSQLHQYLKPKKKKFPFFSLISFPLPRHPSALVPPQRLLI